MEILEEDSQEEVDASASPELSFRRQRSLPSSRLSLGQPSTSRQSVGNTRLSVGQSGTSRQSLNGPTRQSVGRVDRQSVGQVAIDPTPPAQCRLSRPPLRDLSVPFTSPQVDILKTQRHPAVVLSDLVTMNHPALPPQYSQLSPHSTPILPTPSPANKRTSAPVIPVEEFPENPSESFLEQMCDNDPLEGPSWLFASVHKKKRRSSAVRKLSAVWSDSERGSSVGTTGTSGRITPSSLDSSDLDMSSPGEGASSREVSGYVLDRDLLETAVVVATPDVTLETSSAEVTPAKPATSSSSNVAVNSVTAFEEDMDMTTSVEARTDEDLYCSNQENNPVQLGGVENIDESVLSISVTHTPRTPLSSLTYTEPSGQVVKFNPRTDTGVTVAGLREAHILLNNVGMTDSTSTTPYKLSECYIDLSPGRSMSLDQLFSLGLRAGISSPVSNSPKRKKRKHASDVPAVQANQPSKKRRVTDLPGMRQKGVRASLDLIPPNMTQSTDLVVNRANIDTSSGSNIAARLVNVEGSKSMEGGANTGLGLDVTSAPELDEVMSARKLDNVTSVHALNDVTSVPELSAPELETVESVNAATANNIDEAKKKSVMPSFVLLEKSPTKTA